MSGRTIKARFVGGPLHNRVMECARLPVFKVPICTKVVSIWETSLVPHESTFEQREYRLCGFVSEGGAKFSQYVYENYIVDGAPDRVTYTDSELPKLPDEYFWRFLDRLVWPNGHA